MTSQLLGSPFIFSSIFGDRVPLPAARHVLHMEHVMMIDIHTKNSYAETVEGKMFQGKIVFHELSMWTKTHRHLLNVVV